MKMVVKLFFAIFASVVLAAFAYVALTVIQPTFKSIANKGYGGAPSFSIQATLAVTLNPPASVTYTLNVTTGPQPTVQPSSIQPTAVQTSTVEPTSAIKPMIVLPDAPTRGPQSPTEQTARPADSMQPTGQHVQSRATQPSRGSQGATQPTVWSLNETQPTSTQSTRSLGQLGTVQPAGRQTAAGATLPTGGPQGVTQSTGVQPGATQPNGSQPTGEQGQTAVGATSQSPRSQLGTGTTHSSGRPLGGTQQTTTQLTGGQLGTMQPAGGQTAAGTTQSTGSQPGTAHSSGSPLGGSQPTGGQATTGTATPRRQLGTGIIRTAGGHTTINVTQSTGVQPAATQPTRSGGPLGTTQQTGNVTARTVTTSAPPDPCLTNNGGCSDYCERIGPMAVDCVCPTGRMLQSDMKTCQDCPYGKFGDSCAFTCSCDNNATCDAVLGTCLCPTSFTGHDCSTSTLQCNDGYCQNGGTCSVSFSSLTCTCTLLWEGNQCESPRPIPPICLTLANNQSLSDCLTRFLPNIVSSDDDGASGRDGTSELSIYITVGAVVPLVVAALVAAVVLLCRQSSQENEDTHYGDDTSVVYNSAFEQVSGLDSTRNADNSEDSSDSNSLNQFCNNSRINGAGQEIAARYCIASASVANGSSNATVTREQATLLPPLMVDNTMDTYNRYQTMDFPSSTNQMYGKQKSEASNAPDDRPTEVTYEEILTL